MSSRVVPVTALIAVALAGLAASDYETRLAEQVPHYDVEIGDFAPMYPVLAQQLVDDFGVRTGVAVEVGGSAGSLAMALARVTELTVYMVDLEPAATRLCGLRVDEAGLTGRVIPLEGDALDLPLRDGLANLVVSRGSIFFWPDQLAGLLECYRILAPGGTAYVGGGFPRALDPAIREDLVQRYAMRLQGQPPVGWRPLEADLVERLQAAGVTSARFMDDAGSAGWIVMEKPSGD
jgi:SAM-dependent methyltransferase